MRWIIRVKHGDSRPPPFKLQFRACAFPPPTHPQGFRPVSEPFGHFRLFVLLIVDLTRIQPNIQRSVLFINRLVCLTWSNLHRSVHELVFFQVLGPNRGVFWNVFSISCPLDGSYACYTCCYRLRVCVRAPMTMWSCCGWRRRALHFLTGLGVSFTGMLKCSFVVSGLWSACPFVDLPCLSFCEWGVWLAGGKQSSFPFSLECSWRGKKKPSVNHHPPLSCF